MASRLRTRLRAALHWLAPSAVAACAGALVAGLVEGPAGGAVGALATIGFVGVLAVPALVVAGAVVRGLVAAWRPRELALVEDDGAAPRLAGWVAVIWLGAFGLAAVMFQSVLTMSLRTAFKPLTLSFVEPAIAVAAALGFVALSRPGARLFAWLARRIDARWRRGGRRTLLRPWIIAATAGVAALAMLYAVWRLIVRHRLGPLDTSLAHAPIAALATAAALHAAWPRLRARRAIGLSAAIATAAALAAALVALVARPALTLEIWGDRPLAGLAIETLFDLDAIRTRISADELRPAARPGAPHPDIILITIDTVRADHTPPYGGNADMPMLRDLALRGTVFDWTFAPSNVTRRSIPSMITGLSPHRVRGRVVGWALRLDPRHVLVAERLRAGGYDTAGFVCCEGIWGEAFHTGLERGLSHLEIEPRGAALATRARAWLDERERRPAAPPLFLWMHILEPHNWAAGEPRGDAERRILYDRALAASDQMVADVLAAFHRRAPDRMPLVIITADHGEALGEHNQPFHSTDLYNSQIHVPFIIQGPGIKPQRIPETVSLTDLAPTLLDLAGFVPTTPSDGRSLAPLATGARPADPDGGTAFAAMIKDRSNPGGITAIIKGRWKLILNHTTPELYDTRSDPAERQNLVAEKPTIAAELRALLDAHLATARTSPFR